MSEMGELINQECFLEKLGDLDGISIILPDPLGVERVIDRTS